MNTIEYKLEKSTISPQQARMFRGAIMNKLIEHNITPIQETETHITWVLPQDEGERIKAILGINTSVYNLEENTLA